MQADSSPAEVKMLYSFLTTQLYIAISKKTPPEVTAAWKKVFEEMREDGTFTKIYKKYFPERELPGKAITVF